MTTTRTGLTAAEVIARQKKYGKNEIAPQKKPTILKEILGVLREPMFVLLLAAAGIYFVLGEHTDAIVLLSFVVFIIAIEVIQEWRTDKTLAALRNLSEPTVTVIRGGKEMEIRSSELVPGDIALIYEGVKIPADGVVLESHDLQVDESTLTGESEGVWKIPVAGDNDEPTADRDQDYWRKDYVYAGTLALQGSATIQVEKIGLSTEHGKISRDITAAPDKKSPLQIQTGKLVKTCAIIALVLFVLVTAITFFNTDGESFGDRIIESLLSGIALAMAMIPEEFPVILTVFLSLGAWRLAKQKSLVRKLPAVETLGEVSVLCVDKTGTITMNQMAVTQTWALDETASEGDDSPTNARGKYLGEILTLACETDPYDPMEKAMLAYAEAWGVDTRKLQASQMVSEFPFTNAAKMMAHVWRRNGEILITAKGSPEQILGLCRLSAAERKAVDAELTDLSEQGLRIIAVAEATLEKESQIPKKLTDAKLTFAGLVALTDPPRREVKKDIATCYRAGIRVVMITGDNGMTASSIAQQIGMRDPDHILIGKQLDQLTDAELKQAVKTTTVFSRVIPEHKMRIVKALQANGEIVAMTGDGVNDAPALKHADIGISMAKRGSEVSREAADLILLDDNFGTIVNTIRDGRRIYDNIRKAIGYVFTIHIPIAFSALLAPILGIEHGSLLLLPIHVVLLELILDPTCSIVLERQPAEPDIMRRPPRSHKEKIVNARILIKSILQGLAIFAASFAVYFFTLSGDPENAPLARSLGLATIMLANLFLVQVNSSHTETAIAMVKKLSRDKVMWITIIATIVLLGIILYTPLSAFFRLAPLDPLQLIMVLALAAVSTLWYDIVKIIKRKRNK